MRLNNLNKLYHCTSKSNNLTVGDYLLPSIETGNLRESFRNNLLDVVFCSVSLTSCNKYAKLIPDPVIFEVEVHPDDFVTQRFTEVLCLRAKIIRELKK